MKRTIIKSQLFPSLFSYRYEIPPVYAFAAISNCALQSSSILRLASDAPGLRLDESRSLLVWDLPRGRETPYNVTVVMASPGGEKSILRH